MEERRCVLRWVRSALLKVVLPAPAGPRIRVPNLDMVVWGFFFLFGGRVVAVVVRWGVGCTWGYARVRQA